MTATRYPTPHLEVEGWRAMDEIEQLVDQSRQDRIDTARKASQAHEELLTVERQLRGLQRAYVDAWDKAAAAGWTVRELRALKLPEPPQEYRPKTRNRRKRSDVKD